MDALILYKAFLQYLKDPEPSKDFEHTTNIHLINIRCYELRMQESKDRFIGYYSHAYRILTPRLESLCRYVIVPELGGTIELKDAKYDEVHNELIDCFEKCEKLYQWIEEYKSYIAKEYSLVEKEKDADALRKWRYTNWRPERIDAPKCKGDQLKIEFE